MTPTHSYRTRIRWTGNLGSGTREYRGYTRDHLLEVAGKPAVPLTSGLSPRSDAQRLDPEELVVAALSSCHMLWYLHLCSAAGVVVTDYVDDAEGTLSLDRDGGGRMTSVILRPHVVVADGATELARSLHDEAHRKCFVANSVNFPVACEAQIERRAPAPTVP
jgi:organic hydroperoxide reductase OsmC/OhrA